MGYSEKADHGLRSSSELNIDDGGLKIYIRRYTQVDRLKVEDC